MAMGARTEAGTETFGSSISADEDTEKEAAGPEAARPEQPLEPPVEKNMAPRQEKPIKDPEAAGPETPSETRTEEDATLTKAIRQHAVETPGLLRGGGQ